MKVETTWELLCKRTNYPKLGYIIYRLQQAGIPYKLSEGSFHADPLLYVDKVYFLLANHLLGERWSKTKRCPNAKGKTTLGDMPDDDKCFTQFATIIKALAAQKCLDPRDLI